MAKALPSLPNGTANTNLYSMFPIGFRHVPLGTTVDGRELNRTLPQHHAGCIVLTERTGDVLARIRAGHYESFISDSTH